MKARKKIIMIPGFGGYAEGGWPQWLEKEFVKNGFDFSYLEMPNIMTPQVSEWMDFLENKKFKVNQDTYFIGHSLGCITIARYLETLPISAVAGGCVFVAGFCSIPKLPLVADFCSLPLDFSEVKKHAQEFVTVLSDNDLVIPRQFSEELAGKLGSRIIVENKKGHFLAGVKELDSVLNTILEMEQMREETKEINNFRKIRGKKE